MNLILESNGEKNRTAFCGLLVLVVYLVASWPTVVGFVQAWLCEDNSHGFFIIPAVLYLIWLNNQKGCGPISAWTWLGTLGVIFFGLLSTIGMLARISTLSNVSFVGSIWSVFLFVYGPEFVKKNRRELFMLIFMVPIPARIYAALTVPLQVISTYGACYFLHTIGMPVYGEGNSIVMPNATLDIVNACSGLRSIVTIFVLSYILACFNQLSFFWSCFCLLVSIFIALLVNMIRIIVVSLFTFNDIYILTNEPGHVVLGVILFFISINILLISNRVVTWLSKIK